MANPNPTPNNNNNCVVDAVLEPTKTPPIYPKLLRNLHRLDPLHNHRRCCAPTVANGRNTILTRLELMEQRYEDARTRAAEGVA